MKEVKRNEKHYFTCDVNQRKCINKRLKVLNYLGLASVACDKKLINS